MVCCIFFFFFYFFLFIFLLLVYNRGNGFCYQNWYVLCNVNDQMVDFSDLYRT